jgi:hypothetical protein
MASWEAIAPFAVSGARTKGGDPGANTQARPRPRREGRDDGRGGGEVVAHEPMWRFYP